MGVSCGEFRIRSGLRVWDLEVRVLDLGNIGVRVREAVLTYLYLAQGSKIELTSGFPCKTIREQGLQDPKYSIAILSQRCSRPITSIPNFWSP